MKDQSSRNDFNLLKLPELRSKEGSLKTRMMITHSFHATQCDYLSIKGLNTPPASYVNKVFYLA